MNHQAVFDSRWDQVEEAEHGEDTAEYGEVDDRRVARKGLRDHVTGERRDENGKEELPIVSVSVVSTTDCASLCVGYRVPGRLAKRC